MGRIQHTMKNIVFGYIGNLSSTVLGFILRTVFIMKLDENERSTQIRLMKVKDMMLEEAHGYSERKNS